MIVLLASLAAAEGLPPGRYALAVDVVTRAELPWFPPTRGGSRSDVLVDLAWEEGVLVQRGRVCRVDIDAGRLATIEVPPAFLAALKPTRAEVVVEGGRYRADLGVETVGFVGDILPADAASAADWDGDGRAGATIKLRIPAIGAAEIYVAQVAHLVLSGHLVEGEVRGGIEVRRFEQVTLGAKPGWLAARSRVTVDVPRSGFVLRPIGADAGCGEVLAARR